MSERRECPHCDYSVPSRRGYSLKRHVKRKHPEHYDQFLIDYNKKYTKVKKDFSFTCKNCGKKHPSKGTHKKEFCNQSCAATYNNQNRIVVKKESPVKLKNQIQRIVDNFNKLINEDRDWYFFDVFQKKVNIEKMGRLNPYFILSVEFYGTEFIDSLKINREYKKDFFIENINYIATNLYNEMKNHNTMIKKQRKDNFEKANQIIEKYKITEIGYWGTLYSVYGLEEIDWLFKYARHHKKTYSLLYPPKTKDANLHDKIYKERVEAERVAYLQEQGFSLKSINGERKEVIMHEKISRKKFDKSFYPLMESLGCEVIEEYKVRESSNHRIDYLIKKGDTIIGIEYKSTNAKWSPNHLERQKKFYKKYLIKKYPNVEVIIVSDDGKYGMSNNDCLKYLKKAINEDHSGLNKILEVA